MKAMPFKVLQNKLINLFHYINIYTGNNDSDMLWDRNAAISELCSPIEYCKFGNFREDFTFAKELRCLHIINYKVWKQDFGIG